MQIAASGCAHRLFGKKIVAIFLSFSLTLYNCLSYASEIPAAKPSLPAKTMPAFSEIVIPEKLGSISGLIPGSGPRSVIYIQDAHDSFEAQKNIAAIITNLVKNYGVKTVYQEGYEGPVPTDAYFRLIKDHAVRKKISRFLMDKLRIGGAEYAHINRQNDFSLVGADDLKLHRKNIESYREVAALKDETDKDLAVLQSEIEKLARRYLSEKLKGWMKIKVLFDEGKLNLLDYLKRTVQLYGQTEDLVAKAYPAVSKLLAPEKSGSPIALEAIRPEQIFRDINRLEDDLARNSLNSQRERKIFWFYKNLRLLKRLSALEITSAEYEALRRSILNIDTRELAEFVGRNTNRSVILSKKWEGNIDRAIRFYELARKRDGHLERFLKRLNGVKDSSPVILVFGGFHKEAIEGMLKKDRIAACIVAPRIRSLSKRHQIYYRQLMARGYLDGEAKALNINATIHQRIYDQIPVSKFPDYLKQVLPAGLAREWLRTGQVRPQTKDHRQKTSSEKVFGLMSTVFGHNERSEVRRDKFVQKIASALHDLFVPGMAMWIFGSAVGIGLGASIVFYRLYNYLTETRRLKLGQRQWRADCGTALIFLGAIGLTSLGQIAVWESFFFAFSYSIFLHNTIFRKDGLWDHLFKGRSFHNAKTGVKISEKYRKYFWEDQRNRADTLFVLIAIGGFINVTAAALFATLIFIHECGHYLEARWTQLAGEKERIPVYKPGQSRFKPLQRMVEFVLANEFSLSLEGNIRRALAGPFFELVTASVLLSGMMISGIYAGWPLLFFQITLYSLTNRFFVDISQNTHSDGKLAFRSWRSRSLRNEVPKHYPKIRTIYGTRSYGKNGMFLKTDDGVYLVDLPEPSGDDELKFWPWSIAKELNRSITILKYEVARFDFKGKTYVLYKLPGFPKEIAGDYPVSDRSEARTSEVPVQGTNLIESVPATILPSYPLLEKVRGGIKWQDATGREKSAGAEGSIRDGKVWQIKAPHLDHRTWFTLELPEVLPVSGKVLVLKFDPELIRTEKFPPEFMVEVINDTNTTIQTVTVKKERIPSDGVLRIPLYNDFGKLSAVIYTFDPGEKGIEPFELVTTELSLEGKQPADQSIGEAPFLVEHEEDAVKIRAREAAFWDESGKMRQLFQDIGVDGGRIGGLLWPKFWPSNQHDFPLTFGEMKELRVKVSGQLPPPEKGFYLWMVYREGNLQRKTLIPVKYKAADVRGDEVREITVIIDPRDLVFSAHAEGLRPRDEIDWLGVVIPPVKEQIDFKIHQIEFRRKISRFAFTSVLLAAAAFLGLFITLNYFVVMPLSSALVARSPLFFFVVAPGITLLDMGVSIPTNILFNRYVLKKISFKNKKEIFDRIRSILKGSLLFGIPTMGFFLNAAILAYAVNPIVKALILQAFVAPLLFDPLGYTMSRWLCAGRSFPQTLADLRKNGVSFSLWAFLVWFPGNAVAYMQASTIGAFIVQNITGLLWGILSYNFIFRDKVVFSAKLSQKPPFPLNWLQAFLNQPWLESYLLSWIYIFYSGTALYLLSLVLPSPLWLSAIFSAHPFWTMMVFVTAWVASTWPVARRLKAKITSAGSKQLAGGSDQSSVGSRQDADGSQLPTADRRLPTLPSSNERSEAREGETPENHALPENIEISLRDRENSFFEIILPDDGQINSIQIYRNGYLSSSGILEEQAEKMIEGLLDQPVIRQHPQFERIKRIYEEHSWRRNVSLALGISEGNIPTTKAEVKANEWFRIEVEKGMLYFDRQGHFDVIPTYSGEKRHEKLSPEKRQAYEKWIEQAAALEPVQTIWRENRMARQASQDRFKLDFDLLPEVETIDRGVKREEKIVVTDENGHRFEFYSNGELYNYLSHPVSFQEEDSYRAIKGRLEAIATVIQEKALNEEESKILRVWQAHRRNRAYMKVFGVGQYRDLPRLSTAMDNRTAAVSFQMNRLGQTGIKGKIDSKRGAIEIEDGEFIEGTRRPANNEEFAEITSAFEHADGPKENAPEIYRVWQDAMEKRQMVKDYTREEFDPFYFPDYVPGTPSAPLSTAFLYLESENPGLNNTQWRISQKGEIAVISRSGKTIPLSDEVFDAVQNLIFQVERVLPEEAADMIQLVVEWNRQARELGYPSFMALPQIESTYEGLYMTVQFPDGSGIRFDQLGHAMTGRDYVYLPDSRDLIERQLDHFETILGITDKSESPYRRFFNAACANAAPAGEFERIPGIGARLVRPAGESIMIQMMSSRDRRADLPELWIRSRNKSIVVKSTGEITIDGRLFLDWLEANQRDEGPAFERLGRAYREKKYENLFLEIESTLKYLKEHLPGFDAKGEMAEYWREAKAKFLVMIENGYDSMDYVPRVVEGNELPVVTGYYRGMDMNLLKESGLLIPAERNLVITGNWKFPVVINRDGLILNWSLDRPALGMGGDEVRLTTWWAQPDDRFKGEVRRLMERALAVNSSLKQVWEAIDARWAGGGEPPADSPLNTDVRSPQPDSTEIGTATMKFNRGLSAPRSRLDLSEMFAELFSRAMERWKKMVPESQVVPAIARSEAREKPDTVKGRKGETVKKQMFGAAVPTGRQASPRHSLSALQVGPKTKDQRQKTSAEKVSGLRSVVFGLNERSELLRPKLENVIHLKENVYFSIRPETLMKLEKYGNKYGGNLLQEFVGLKIINEDKLHIILAVSSDQALNDRAWELFKHHRHVYLGLGPDIPRNAPVIHFEDLEGNNEWPQKLDERLYGQLRACFGIFDGTFISALFYAQKLKPGDALSQRTIEMIDRPTAMIAALVEEFFTNYAVFAQAA